MLPILFTILGLIVEIFIQTVFLTAALWIMIKIQKLEYNFPGLLGSAALGSAVESVLNLIVGDWMGFGPFSNYITTPFVLLVLFLCIKKVTEADTVDVAFTIAVGGAIQFGMNLWLIGALMGDLRPAARDKEDYDNSMPPQEVTAEAQPAIRTNKPATSTAAKPTTPAKPAAPAQAAPASPPATPVEEIVRSFSIKGITRNGANSSVSLQSGTKLYTLFLGESAAVQTGHGEVSVGFKELNADGMVLTVNGQDVTLPNH